MKTPGWIWLLALFLVAKTSVIAADPEVEVGRVFSPSNGMVTVLTAAKNDAAKVEIWKPGDEDILPLRALVELATKRVQLPGDKKYQPPRLEGASWTGFGWNFDGVASRWLIEVRFHCFEAPERLKIMTRDGDRYVEVFMLPNGAPVTVTTRAMTHEEKVELGLEQMTDKEMEQYREKYPGAMPPTVPFAKKTSK